MEDLFENPGQVATVIMELVGGPFDGKTFVFEDRGQMPSLENWDEEAQAVAMYRDSSNGNPGKRFRVHSDCPANEFPHTVQVGASEARVFAEYDLVKYQEHEYVVTDRLRAANEVLVRANYTNDPSPASAIIGNIRRRPK